MAFSSSLDNIRRLGRKVVLPSKKIKEIVTDCIPQVDLGIVDLGAGTQGWSKWLKQKYETDVFAIDTYYKTNGKKTEIGIIEYCDYFECVYTEKNIGMIWCCDVLHHLNGSYMKRLFNSFDEVGYKYIVVKDIDCRHKLGNFMNRMHDLIINHEKIADVNPVVLIQMFNDKGYRVHYEFLPKLWYPHFLLIAIK